MKEKIKLIKVYRHPNFVPCNYCYNYAKYYICYDNSMRQYACKKHKKFLKGENMKIHKLTGSICWCEAEACNLQATYFATGIDRRTPVVEFVCKKHRKKIGEKYGNKNNSK